MNKGASRALKVYPWYSAITGDLLFYIAISSLFLTFVKGFSAAEIVSLSSISQTVCIVVEFPILFVMKKIGNTASVRIGAFCLLLSAIFITFGKTYLLVLVGKILHDIAAVFKNAAVVALENNLDLLDSRSDFVRCRTVSNTIYSIITMLISLVASYMFNLNNYLPMICCITTCATGFVLSLYMKDYSAYNKTSSKSKARTRVKINVNAAIIIIVILYSLYYSIVSNGQSEGNLFIQQNLLLDFDKEKTALIIGVVVFVSRVVRVLSNLIFGKLYKKHMSIIGIMFTILLTAAFSLLLFGSFIPQIVVKILVMGLGYAIILFARDPFKLYMVDTVFARTPKEQHKTILIVFGLGVKIATAGTGLVFSAILLSYPLSVTMGVMLVIAVITIALSAILHRMISAEKQPETDSV